MEALLKIVGGSSLAVFLAPVLISIKAFRRVAVQFVCLFDLAVPCPSVRICLVLIPILQSLRPEIAEHGWSNSSIECQVPGSHPSDKGLEACMCDVELGPGCGRLHGMKHFYPADVPKSKAKELKGLFFSVPTPDCRSLSCLASARVVSVH